ncbi:OapA family protein [Hahella sp. HN01]|uniref:OapA family protein n=1 Tax=unclassified Hahella TaxID=2624107 RepID=UPI001C1F04CE|nr:peptidoglycan DD-metalloendopeptidase family protein [Hahella sp. HN01]MBU6955447.1 peptidoglycan DD-metalloendopeptidase family protein [Hahella sp. HN01]
MLIKKILPKFSRIHFLAVAAAGSMLGSALILSPSEQAAAGRITLNIPLDGQPTSQADSSSPLKDLPEDSASAKIKPLIPSTAEPATETPAPATVEPEIAWNEFEVRNGDSLSSLFKRAGASSAELAQMVDDIPGKEWTQIFPGEKLDFAFDSENKLSALRIHRSQLENWLINANAESKFELEKVVLKPDVQTAYAEGVIKSALFIDAKNAGLPDSLIMDLANIFGWDVDFVLDIRSGDSFKLVYEELFLDGKKISNGNILAAEFTNQGETYTAVRYEDQEGKTGYFTPDGKSLKKAFLRTPIDFARISSHFNLQRKHPVLHKFRAHKGTDYAAGRGTPIKASGDGKVIFAGRKGGYGNVVILQHGQSITTLYAHMKGFARGIKNGKRINQGQVIGYVGSSGLATGPHLHYEFRVNGVHKNPVTVKFPHAQPVASNEMSRFKEQAQTALAQMQAYSDSYQVAKRDSLSSDNADL